MADYQIMSYHHSLVIMRNRIALPVAGVPVVHAQSNDRSSFEMPKFWQPFSSTPLS